MPLLAAAVSRGGQDSRSMPLLAAAVSRGGQDSHRRRN
jgi:hypothetical protein